MIALVSVIAGLLLWRWKRWHEAVMLGPTPEFEATAFIFISTIAKRLRRNLERLLDSSVSPPPGRSPAEHRKGRRDECRGGCQGRRMSGTIAIWNPACGSVADESDLRAAFGDDVELVPTTEDDPGPG